MNSLSFLIYLSGVTGSMSGFLILVTTAFGVLAAISLIVWLLSHDETDSAGRTLESNLLEGRRQTRKFTWKWFWVFTGLFVLSGTLSAVVPNRQTVLLIAASEMGEKVLNHPRTNQVIDPGIELLTTWMQKETLDIKKQMVAPKPTN